MNTTRPYVRPVPWYWWLRRPAYVRYMLRELTCVPIGAWSGWLVYGLVSLARGPEAWTGFTDGLASAPGIAFQILVLASAAYHAVTWFNLAPRTMPLRLGGRRVPAAWITLGHYAVAAVVALALLVMGVV